MWFVYEQLTKAKAPKAPKALFWPKLCSEPLPNVTLSDASVSKMPQWPAGFSTKSKLYYICIYIYICIYVINAFVGWCWLRRTVSTKQHVPQISKWQNFQHRSGEPASLILIRTVPGCIMGMTERKYHTSSAILCVLRWMVAKSCTSW